MTVHRARGPALAALFLLVACPSLATPSTRLQPALQRALAPSGMSIDMVSRDLDEALSSATVLQAAALASPEGRRELAATLSSAGLSPEAQEELVPGLIAAAREASMGGVVWTEPLLHVGSYELSLQELSYVVGPREGRDRRAVLARLAEVSAGDGVPHEDALLAGLVPQLVAAAESARAGDLLARVGRALVANGEDQ